MASSTRSSQRVFEKNPIFDFRSYTLIFLTIMSYKKATNIHFFLPAIASKTRKPKLAV